MFSSAKLEYMVAVCMIRASVWMAGGNMTCAYQNVERTQRIPVDWGKAY